MSNFLGNDGKLSIILEEYFGKESGKLLSILNNQIGPGSEFSKNLDPSNKNSVVSKIQEIIQQFLIDNSSKILDEFSLDIPDSSMSRLKKSPMDFGIQVRDNPLSLVITAMNKMGAAKPHKQSVTLASRFIETTALPCDKKQLLDNFNLSKNFILNLSTNKETKIKKHHRMTGILFQKVSIDKVNDFLIDFISRSPLTNPVSPITRYINERIDEFNEWDVFITCPQQKTKYPNRTIKIGEFIIPTSTRQLINESEDKIKFANGKVSGRGIEMVGLSHDAVRDAIANWIKQMWDKISKGQVKNDAYPDSIFRIEDRKPLLIIHFLDLFKTKESDRHLCDLQDFAHTAWSISFPPTKYEQDKTDYIVNKVWRQQNFFNNLSEQEEDELRGSDGN